MPSLHLLLCSLFILHSVFTAKIHLPSVAGPQGFVRLSGPTILRREREVASATDSDYSWKAAKTPPFITTQLKKQQAEPILTFFPPEGAFRNSKSRDIFPHEYNVGKRIVYHTTLPDVSHSSTRPPHNPYAEFVGPLRSDQRSYSPSKTAHEFVTRVKSVLINVAEDNKSKDNRKSNPPFMIIDNPSPQYPANGLNRFIQQPSGAYHNKHMTGISYHHQSPYHAHRKPYISDFKLPYSSSLPHYNAGNDVGISQYQYQYQHQSSPYYEEVEKIHTPGHEFQHYQSYASNSPLLSTPYPSRHIRFPSDRYPLHLQFDGLLPSSKPLLNKNPLDSGFLQQSPNLGLGDSLSTNPGNFDFNENLGPVTMDHNSALDDNHFGNKPLSVRNKFPNFNKYPATSNNFNSDDFPFNSQFSDKPFDLGAFSLAAEEISDDVTGDKDYHIKGSNGFGLSKVNATTETPPTTSQPDMSTEESQTDSDYGGELDT